MKIYRIITKNFTLVLVVLIQFYRLFISPLLPNVCRYYPTCSCYAIEAIKIHGILVGLILGIKRILRCHPFGASGIDQVPENKNLH